MLFVYCLCRLCIHMFPEGGGHVFYMLRVHFSVALFTSFYASPVIICGWDKQMKSLENDLEQHGTVRNGLDYNSYVWRNAERSADIYKVAQTLDTKTKVSSCSVDFADMSSFSQTVCKMCGSTKTVEQTVQQTCTNFTTTFISSYNHQLSTINQETCKDESYIITRSLKLIKHIVLLLKAISRIF